MKQTTQKGRKEKKITEVKDIVWMGKSIGRQKQQHMNTYEG